MISDCHGLMRGWGQVGIGCGYKRAPWRNHVLMEMFYILTIAMPAPWLWHCSMVLPDDTTRVNEVKDTWVLVLFLTSECKSMSSQ